VTIFDKRKKASSKLENKGIKTGGEKKCRLRRINRLLGGQVKGVIAGRIEYAVAFWK